jgi:hypothetical protein
MKNLEGSRKRLRWKRKRREVTSEMSEREREAKRRSPRVQSCRREARAKEV